MRHCFYMVKSALFHPKAREIIREFPGDVKKTLGKLIFDVQKGARLEMPVSRPMASVALGVEELRIKDRSGIYRAFYFARVDHAVIVFHAFVKKAQKTPKREMELGKKRLKEML